MLLIRLMACRPDTWIDVAAGDDVTCAVAASGRVACWGVSLGGVSMSVGGENIDILGAPDDRLVSVDMLPVGGPVACGLTNAGHPACWGANFGGELEAPPRERFVDLAIDDGAVCGLHDDGSLTCWGDSPVAMPDVPLSDLALQFQQVRGVGTDGALVWTGEWPAAPQWAGLVEIEATTWSGLTVRTADARVIGWGADIPGDLPLASQLSTNDTGGCVLDLGGRPRCWGDDRIPALPDEPWSKISAGDGHVCGLRPDGTIVCFGDDEFGQVSTVAETPPFRIDGRE